MKGKEERKRKRKIEEGPCCNSPWTTFGKNSTYNLRSKCFTLVHRFPILQEETALSTGVLRNQNFVATTKLSPVEEEISTE